MGATYVTAAIRNPADLNLAWEGQFRVDTGITDSMVPRKHLEAIGLQPRAQRTYSLADGTKTTLDVAIAEIEVMGLTVGGMVLYGDDDVEPLLGVTALESGGIELDPLDQTVKLLPTIRL